MSFNNVISLLGGVALFLYGMSVMGGGLEKLSGGKVERTLEKLTNNLLSGVALGALVTALIQSSSATTVIIVGLVNAGILQLRQAVGVIMGANIGTTITAQLIRLSDIQSDSIFLILFKPVTLAPLAAVVGIILFMTSKRTKRREVGQMLVGFGVLFAGMFAMESAVQPLRTSPLFLEILAAMSNPVLGVLAGAVITAIIQSSAASIGMLQALSSTGILPFSTAFPIIMGQNIGTCITPILASIGASKNAKRSAMIHLYFNIVGTVVFLSATYGLIALLGSPAFWASPVGRSGIANFHTLFNVSVTLLLLPFAGAIEKLARLTIKNPKEHQEENVQKLLDDRFLYSPGIALQQCENVLTTMAELAQKNYLDGIALLVRFDSKLAERIREAENAVDKMEDKVENYLIKLSSQQLTEKDSRRVSVILHLVKDYERISDYAINLVECSEEMFENHITFSPKAVEEVDVLVRAVSEIIELANEANKSMSTDIARRIEPLEETIDAIVNTLKDMHVERLKAGECSVEAGIVFLEILTNLERIADHCSNVGSNIIGSEDKRGGYESHEYIRSAHEATDTAYVETFNNYMERYYSALGPRP